MTSSPRARLPFRIGTTSFVYRGGWLHNVQRLAGVMGDIELLFFEDTELPSRVELEAIAALRRAHGFSLSVHTPLAASLASEREDEREEGVARVLRIVELCAWLEPEAYVVHVYQGDREGDAPPNDLDAWRVRADRSLRALLAAGVAPRALCVEQLDYDLRALEPVIAALDLSVALDIGHLQRDGRDVHGLLDHWLERTRLIQWHGTDDTGRDHRSLTFFPETDALRLLETLLRARWDGVLTLEVFREEDFVSSQAQLERWLQTALQKVQA
jgi:sugar phosphate isomerase/epimerase